MRAPLKAHLGADILKTAEDLTEVTCLLDENKSTRTRERWERLVDTSAGIGSDI
jgi:hypothetical protein